MKVKINKVGKIVGWISLSGVLLIALLNLWVIISSQSQISYNPANIGFNNVGLVLGTSKKLRSGAENPYFNSRINTAATLYKLGKIKHILVSGDNRSKYYNEPLDMQKALVKKGIPDSVITLDYAGLRTLDSVVRCKDIFGQNKFTIITQKFHATRAIFISNYYKIEAQAMVAPSPPIAYSWKVKLREVLARPIAIIDLYILKKTPKHKGKKEFIKT